MKRVTKKLVLAVLSMNGWNFSHNFKESQRILLFDLANEPRIIALLAANGISVSDHTPCRASRTGSIKLTMAE